MTLHNKATFLLLAVFSAAVMAAGPVSALPTF